MLGGLGKVVEVVGVFAEVDEAGSRILGIVPWDNEDGIIGAAFCRPVSEHNYIRAQTIASREQKEGERWRRRLFQ